MHIFNLNSLFIKFLHTFVLPNVASACIAGAELVHVSFYDRFRSELTGTLKIILSYKSFFGFFMTCNICIKCRNTSVYM